MTTRACPTCGTMLPADAPEKLCPRCLLRVAMESNPSPGGAFVPPAPKDLAPHFPQLEIIGLIGHGGMGAVYKARQVKLDRLVALKILPRQADSDPAFAERFSREAKALARLQHPHIVTVHDFGEAGGYYYLIMEHVDGSNLRQVMRTGPVAPDQAVVILSSLAEALAYAHQNEVVHRDLKPENVLIDRRGHVKLADFGLAKLVNIDVNAMTLTGANQALGTPHYMAPEQLERPTEVDHRADIYSLGVVAYELLTGELPLGRFDPPSKRSGVRRVLDEIVMRALERDPARRFQSASEILSALRPQTAAPAASLAPDAEPEPESAGLSMAGEAMGVLGLVLGIICVFVGVIQARSGWFAALLFAVQWVAAAIPWRRSRRPIIGSLLAVGGMAVAVAILTRDPNRWWIIMILVFVYGHFVGQFFKGYTEWHKKRGIADKVPNWSDLAPDEQRVLAAIHEADSDGMVVYPAEVDGEHLANYREANELRPEERVLALVSLSDDGEPAALVFGSQNISFWGKQNGQSVLCTLPYESLVTPFVNHGKAVYAGDGITLTPEDGVDCEALAALLNAVRRAVSGH